MSMGSPIGNCFMKRRSSTILAKRFVSRYRPIGSLMMQKRSDNVMDLQYHIVTNQMLSQDLRRPTKTLLNERVYRLDYWANQDCSTTVWQDNVIVKSPIIISFHTPPLLRPDTRLLLASNLFNFAQIKPRSHITLELIYQVSRDASTITVGGAVFLQWREQDRQRLSRIDQNIDPICINCGMVAETTEHVIFECNDPYYSEEDARVALGFGENADYCKIVGTKELLENWEKSTGLIRRASWGSSPLK